VLLNSTSPLRMAVTQQHIVAFSAGRHTEQPGAHDFDQAMLIALEVLERAIRSNPIKATSLPRWLGGELPGLALILDNTWVRIFVCRWDPVLKTHPDFVRYAEIEFQRRFHTSAKEWQLVPNRLYPGCETVWCAYSRRQLLALESMANSMGMRVQSILPRIIAELATLRPPARPSPLIFVSAGDRSKNICWIEDGRLRDLIVLSAEAQEDFRLIDTFLARKKMSPFEVISVVRNQGTRANILQSLVAGRSLKTTTESLQRSSSEVVIS
jgi:hypothetical protein